MGIFLEISSEFQTKYHKNRMKTYDAHLLINQRGGTVRVECN